VKNFNIIIQRLIVLTFCVLTIVYLWPIDTPGIRAKRFCAYSELYVEFEYQGKIWGTTFLDESGRPVPCNENPNIQEVEHRTI
jgi:hypothetical protein